MLDVSELCLGSADEAATPVSSASSPTVAPAAGRAPHTSQACDRCRTRKSRCNGERPSCQGCLREKRVCHYSDKADRRKLSQAWKEERRQLHARIQELERAVEGMSMGSGSGSQSATFSQGADPLEYMHRTSAAPDESSVESDWELEPFGSGQLALTPGGNLYLESEATFYRPGRPLKSLAARVRPASLVLGGPSSARSSYGRSAPPAANSSSSSSSGYRIDPCQAPYLPRPLSPDLHAHLLDLCFMYGVSYGMNSFKDEFLAGMRADCMSSQLYYSPLLHLACLANGFRYCISLRDHSKAAGQTHSSYSERGLDFIAKARSMVDEELQEPTLGSILGLLVLSIDCFGMALDQAGTHYYAIAAFLVQDFRLHRRCDDQLRTLGLNVDGELDRARRDVYGFTSVFSCWWTNYFARLSLPFGVEANQRRPFRKVWTSDSEDSFKSSTSEAFIHHCELAAIGVKIVFCNHSWRTGQGKRLELVKHLKNELQAWRRNLPRMLVWPPPDDAKEVTRPDVAILIATYDAYMIQLLRPYITHPVYADVVANAKGICIEATDEMVDILHFIRDFHGVHAAGLALQEMISVGGTMIVLQVSGLGDDSPDHISVKAQRQLRYVLRWLDEFAEVWPTTHYTAELLRKLEQEYCL